MKNTTYKFGEFFFKAQFKTVGQGYEVSVTFDKKTIFVGNFIHKNEATKWWSVMGHEIRHFTETYWIANKAAKTWYGKFFSNHLYKTYYTFLDRLFVSHNKTYKTAFTKQVKKYNSLRRHMNRQDRFHLTKAS